MKTKRIQDSVHGNILIKGEYAKYIVDTPAFQRLRRIEQTAIRSVFPSARHDRFIHSLGVFHIGSLIVQQLHDEACNWLGADNDKIIKKQIETIENSYLVACLLHDIGHAPFSHTFEAYFGTQEDLYKSLNEILKGHLKLSTNEVGDPKFHEYASAIVVCKEFKKEIIEGKLHADMELVCRMIIGAKYKKSTKEHELRDCYISLLHGDVIDADRMDYACRDVWASGYSTSSIDVDRVVNAIHIRITPDTSAICICFDCNALSEITNMLDVRQFQNRRVINHHTVQYEQKLLILAAEEAACKKYKKQDPSEALHCLINVDNCHSGNYISDEDILQMIKEDEGNSYYEEYSTRQYKRFAAWKTPDEFFKYFPEVPRNQNLEHSEFKTKVKEALSDIVDSEDILFIKVKYNKRIDLKKLYIIVNGDVVQYTYIHPELKVELGVIQQDRYFYYIYIPKPEASDEELETRINELRKDIAERLLPVMKDLYPQSDAEYTIYSVIQSALIKYYELLYADNTAEIEKKTALINKMSNKTKTLNDFIIDSKLDDYINSFESKKKETSN